MGNELKHVSPPYGDTGVNSTREKGLIACIDWVGVTFFDAKNDDDFCDILSALKLDRDKFKLDDRGWRGYKYSANYGNILIAWGQSEKTSHFMGYHIEMSGQGCRQYEQIFDGDLDWSRFFQFVNKHEHKISRLDIAIDDYKGYFTIDQLYKKAKNGEILAGRVRKGRSFETFDLNTGETISQTLYIGKSNWLFRFYNKFGQMKDKHIELPDNITFWNRYEIQLRSELATNAAQIIATKSYSVGEFAKGMFKEKMAVKVKNKMDTNKSRWHNVRWWDRFLGDVEKIPLKQVAPDPSIIKIKYWIEKQVSTSLATLLTAFDGDMSIIYYLLKKGQEKMSDKQDYLLEEFHKDEVYRDILEAEIKNYKLLDR